MQRDRADVRFACRDVSNNPDLCGDPPSFSQAVTVISTGSGLGARCSAAVSPLAAPEPPAVPLSSGASTLNPLPVQLPAVPATSGVLTTPEVSSLPAATPGLISSLAPVVTLATSLLEPLEALTGAPRLTTPTLSNPAEEAPTAVPALSLLPPITTIPVPLSSMAPELSIVTPHLSSAAPVLTIAAPVLTIAAPVLSIAAPVLSVAAPDMSIAAPIVVSSVPPVLSLAAPFLSTAAPVLSSAAGGGVSITHPPVTTALGTPGSSVAVPASVTVPPPVSLPAGPGSIAPVLSSAAGGLLFTTLAPAVSGKDSVALVLRQSWPTICLLDCTRCWPGC